ncbi:ABC transporter permease [Fictibacillus sp. Mic-4]|uniref:ABC transporter permease n=1 Tax=Fictibacillus sp. Mic-4 TaxID=3132826 RepID=UPI003CF6247C
MVIFQNNIKRLLRNKGALLAITIIPLIFMALILASTDTQKLKVGLIDQDKSPFTKQFAENLKKKADFVSVNEKNYRNQLISGYAEYVIILPKGFTDSLIKGKPISVKSYQVKESNVSAGVKAYVDSYFRNSELISKAAGGDSDQFYKGMKEYEKGNLQVKEKSIGKDNRQNVVSALGFVVYSLFLMINVSSRLILQDKDKKLYHRFFTTPLKLRSYNIQHILSYIFISLMQIICLLAIMIFIFHADLGPSIFNVFIVLFVFSIVSISIGILISSQAKNSKQAQAIAILISTPFAMLGGCFWPIDIMPDVLQKIAEFIPISWGLKALKKLVYGNSLSHVMLELSILAGFAIIFFLLSSWKKEDIAK